MPMQNLYDYKKFAILYVDDEEKSLKYFDRAFSEQFRIFTASNAQDGYRLLEQHKDEIGLIMTDQRMPGEKGVQFLEKARLLRPRIIRILVTAFSDLDAAIQAVNTGAIYKYITKPWEVPLLETTLKRGLEFFLVQRERDQLLREKMTVLHKMVITDRVISLGVMAAGLGHHIRNALVAVRTFLDLAPEMLHREDLDMEDLRHPHFWNEFYEKVQARVKKIVELLDDIGGVSSKPSFNFTTQTRLHEALAAALQKASPELAAKEILVHTEIPPDLPPLLVDYPKFCRLLELLCRDEAINLPPRSRVNIRARQIAGGAPESAHIEIQIQDNGPGLPHDALRSVFDPFYSRGDNPQEFGLNLIACYFIIYHHGGRIEIHSEKGQGVTFVIQLPVNPKAIADVEEGRDFLTKVMMNDRLWEKLLSTS